MCVGMLCAGYAGVAMLVESALRERLRSVPADDRVASRALLPVVGTAFGGLGPSPARVRGSPRPLCFL